MMSSTREKDFFKQVAKYSNLLPMIIQAAYSNCFLRNTHIKCYVLIRPLLNKKMIRA